MQISREYFQRAIPRSRSIPATLVQPGVPNRSCVVSDISDGGATIVVEGRDPVHIRFELVFGGGQRRVCEPVWWHEGTAYLRFIR